MGSIGKTRQLSPAVNLQQNPFLISLRDRRERLNAAGKHKEHLERFCYRGSGAHSRLAGSGRVVQSWGLTEIENTLVLDVSGRSHRRVSRGVLVYCLSFSLNHSLLFLSDVKKMVPDV